jgi:hypothetical protein
MRRGLSELGLGAQIALASRTTRIRTALTVVGVALGVVLLLGAASVPHALSARDARELAAQPVNGDHGALRLITLDTSFHATEITETALEPVAHPRHSVPVPPGIPRLPGPGEMDVSPAVAALLRGPGGGELRRRLGARVVGTIAARGLGEPDEALLYRGADLAARGVPAGVTGFGAPAGASDRTALITLLVIMIVVALLLPVGVFVAVAARFGAEQRELRLAAMRLVGADRLATARVAAGESLLGALAGLLLGAATFLLARPLAAHAGIAGVDVFTADVRPVPGLALLVCGLVPLSAVLATLLGIRRVTVEPLGVSRRASTTRRRLGWRLTAPALGFALLAPLIGDRARLLEAGGQVQATAGVVLALLGVTALAPWVVDAVVRRAPDGPVPWLLALRRLRDEDGTSGRVVGAIGLAVAGAIALQILFSAAQADARRSVGPATPADTVVVTLSGRIRDGGVADLDALRGVAGVRQAVGVAAATHHGQTLTVGSCAALSRIAVLRRCRDGDAFALRVAGARRQPGGRLRVANVELHVPAGTRLVNVRNAPAPLPFDELLLTPRVARAQGIDATSLTAIVVTAPGDPGALARLRDRAAVLDPLAQVGADADPAAGSRTLTDLRHALVAGAIAVLLMIGASLLVAAGEGLRERRRALSVLAAVGVRRSTMAWSMLWQTAVPVAGGLALAVVLGLALGSMLAAVVHLSPSYDWGAIALMLAVGVAVIGAVTLLTLPTLWRMMRPEALRVE